jgi:hypothetical protein
VTACSTPGAHDSCRTACESCGTEPIVNFSVAGTSNEVLMTTVAKLYVPSELILANSVCELRTAIPVTGCGYDAV